MVEIFGPVAKQSKSDSVTLTETGDVLYAIIELHPSMTHQLSLIADIVADLYFESVIIKMQ